MLTLEFTPESKRIIAGWGKDKTGKLDRARLEWVTKMEAFMMGAAQRSFTIQAQAGGDPWPVNSDGWKIRKMQLGARNTMTNIVTGEMQRSLSSTKDSYSAKVGMSAGWAIYTQDRKDAALNREVMPDDKYVINYGKILFEGILRRMVA
jgi:hypothetical protein